MGRAGDNRPGHRSRPGPDLGQRPGGRFERPVVLGELDGPERRRGDGQPYVVRLRLPVRDQVFDSGSDVYLGYTFATGGLASNASYTANGTFTVPQGLSGIITSSSWPTPTRYLDELQRRANNFGSDTRPRPWSR